MPENKNNSFSTTFSTQLNKVPFLYSILKWILLSIITAIVAGCSSALFLASLEWVTNYRINHSWIIWLLPLAGLGVGILHRYAGKNIDLSNKAIFNGTQFHQPKINWRTAPLLLLSTLITHLFGGSAGREGAALQLSGSLNDQWNYTFDLTPNERKIVMRMAIAAGFGSVFGVPFAGAIFAVEVVALKKFNYKFIIPIFLSAWMANWVTHLFIKSHTVYASITAPRFSFTSFLYIILAAIAFGLTAVLFSKLMKATTSLFEKITSSTILKLLLGSTLLVLGYFIINSQVYCGLGIETIVKAFNEPLDSYSFLLKLVLTVITLSAGFKGGEVTPLFFIGATLGNALYLFIPLPLEMLAGMGFVAVFAAATRTPIASTILAMEIFGLGAGLFCGIACVIACIIGYKSSIYEHQMEKL